MNPTAFFDEVHALHDEQHQYPPPSMEIRQFYHDFDPEDDPNADYPWIGGELVRCSRERHPGLGDAQLFFNTNRELMRWTHEGPIYRTGRFWCKRVWRNGRGA